MLGIAILMIIGVAFATFFSAFGYISESGPRAFIPRHIATRMALAIIASLIAATIWWWFGMRNSLLIVELPYAVRQFGQPMLAHAFFIAAGMMAGLTGLDRLFDRLETRKIIRRAQEESTSIPSIEKETTAQ